MGTSRLGQGPGELPLAAIPEGGIDPPYSPSLGPINLIGVGSNDAIPFSVKRGYSDALRADLRALASNAAPSTLCTATRARTHAKRRFGYSFDPRL